jgi:hypothetical protein
MMVLLLLLFQCVQDPLECADCVVTMAADLVAERCPHNEEKPREKENKNSRFLGFRPILGVNVFFCAGLSATRKND